MFILNSIVHKGNSSYKDGFVCQNKSVIMIRLHIRYVCKVEAIVQRQKDIFSRHIIARHGLWCLLCTTLSPLLIEIKTKSMFSILSSIYGIIKWKSFQKWSYFSLPSVYFMPLWENLWHGYLHKLFMISAEFNRGSSSLALNRCCQCQPEVIDWNHNVIPSLVNHAYR